MRPLRNLWLFSTLLVLLLLGCAGVAYLVFSLVAQAYLPSDGVLLNEMGLSGTTVALRLSPAPAGLEVGDQLLALEGRSLREWVEQAMRGGTAAHLQADQLVTYRVLRDGVSLQVPVRLTSFPVGQLLLLRFGVYLFALISLAISGRVLFDRPQHCPSRLFFVASACFLLISAIPFQTLLLARPVLFLIETGVEFLFESLLFSCTLHLFLIFPTTKSIVQGREKWLNGIHLVNPALAAAIALLVGQSPAEKLLIALLARYWIGLAMLVAALAAVLHTYLTTRQTLVRAQVRWVVWGSAVGVLPFLLLTSLPEVLLGRTILNIEITSFFLIAVPIAIAAAITRYRLFDIEKLIRHTLIYALLTLVLVGLYLLMVAGLGFVVLRLTGQPHDIVTVFISTLVVSTSFWALRVRVARIADRLFYRPRIDPGALLDEIGERLVSVTKVEQIAALLAETVPARVGARHGMLMVPDQDQAHLRPIDDEDHSLLVPIEQLESAWIAHQARPILCCMAPEWFPPALLERVMAHQETEMLVPLIVADQLVGVWGLGPRTGVLSYTSDDVQALSAVARQAAVALQNACLVQRLEQYNQQLEAEIQQRTHTLESERNRLNVILQNIADGLLVTDWSGRVLLVNLAFEEIVRRPARLLLGKSLEQNLAWPPLFALLQQAVETPAVVHTANMALGEKAIKASSSALRDGVTVVTVLRDITHEVEVDRIKSEFISTVSHELRTPLTSVLGFAKIIHRIFDRSLASRLPEDEPTRRAVGRVRENLEIIVAEGERLTRLVNDVLDIAKMEAGGMEWQDELCDSTFLLEQAVQEAQEMVQEKGLLLKKEIPAHLPPLMVDPDRIVQVLTNLISNAVKFTNTGEIVVSARHLPPGESVRGWRAPADGGGLLVAVRDTGVGIAEEDIPRLFLRFQQLRGEDLTDRPKGTGLGLAICRDIVGHYGGVIWADSMPGRGSTFSFTLPAAASAEQVAPVPAAVLPRPTPDPNGFSILVVDDEPAIRNLLVQELEEASYRARAVASGAEAVEWARSYRPDLIVLDVKMPGISGFDVVQILRADPRTAAIPILILSIAEEKERGLALGANAYLSKPIDVKQLLAQISTLLSSPDEGPEEVI
ncbi:MAG: response regulator [Anaerolineae bacterium]|nr:response regulator [Anaerolineae bacterium]